ncbi:MAG: hypothetical protein HQL56_18570 [Magnetococcales bacterium]|nr:hypothetical protein [Magnetococcales bacterium]
MEEPQTADQILLANIQPLRRLLNTGNDLRAVYLQMDAAFGSIPWNTFRTKAKTAIQFWEDGYMTGFEAGARQKDNPEPRPESEVPRTLDGWSINWAKQGEFWRAFRKVGGKSKCIYLGKVYDPDQVQKKITAKNKALNLQSAKEETHDLGS